VIVRADDEKCLYCGAAITPPPQTHEHCCPLGVERAADLLIKGVRFKIGSHPVEYATDYVRQLSAFHGPDHSETVHWTCVLFRLIHTHFGDTE
jgi:hypothetical protein